MANGNTDNPNPSAGSDSEPGGSPAEDPKPNDEPKPCPACECGECLEHGLPRVQPDEDSKPVTRRELRESEKNLRKRVAKSVKRLRDSRKKSVPTNEPSPRPTPEPEPPKKVSTLGAMGLHFREMCKKK